MSTVIKAGQAGTMLHRLSRVDLADHLAEAKQILDDARRQAEQLKARTRDEARRVLEEAKESGFAEGKSQGYEEGLAQGRQTAFEEATARFNAEQATLVADFARAIAEIDRTKSDIRVAAERDVLEFAVNIATQLTFGIGGLHQEAACENLTRALELVDDKSDLTIRVHPTQLETMGMFAGGTFRMLDASKAFQMVGDECVAPGGCVIEGRLTDVDASLETQTRQIVSLLLGREADHD